MNFSQRLKLLEAVDCLRQGAPLPLWLLESSHASASKEEGCAQDDLLLGIPHLAQADLVLRLQMLGLPEAEAHKLCLDEGIDGGVFLRLKKEDMTSVLQLPEPVIERIVEIQSQHRALADAVAVAGHPDDNSIVQVSQVQLRSMLAAYTHAQQLWREVREAVGGLQEEYLCPITHEPLREPVVATDGASYM